MSKANKEVLEQLTIIQHKGACQYTIPKADKAMSKLKALLNEDDYNSLSIARSHYLIGEGADELMIVCKNLFNKFND